MQLHDEARQPRELIASFNDTEVRKSVTPPSTDMRLAEPTSDQRQIALNQGPKLIGPVGALPDGAAL